MSDELQAYHEPGTGARLFNTFLNPFALPDEILHAGGDVSSGAPEQRQAAKDKAALSHAATLAIGLGSLTFATKRLLDKQRRAKGKGPLGSPESDEYLQALLNARQPIISLDPNLDDAEEERKVRAIGAVPASAAPAPGILEKDANGVASDIRSVVTSPARLLAKWIEKSPDFSSIHPGVAMAAALAGVYGGHRLAKKQQASEDEEKVDERLGDVRNQTEAEAFNTLLQQGRLPKTAAHFKQAEMSAADRAALRYAHKSPERDSYRHGSSVESLTHAILTNSPLKTGGGLAALMFLLSLGLSGVAYRGTKNYMDKTDPNRQKLDELRNYMRRKALVEQPPVLMSTIAPARPGADKSLASKRLASVSLPSENPLAESQNPDEEELKQKMLQI